MRVVERTMRVFLAVLLLGAVFAVGAMVGRAGDGQEADPEAKDDASVAVSPSADPETSSPVGTALAWLEFQSTSLYMDAADAEARLDKLVAPDAGDLLADEIEGVDAQHERFEGAKTEVWHTFVPVGTRLVEEAEKRAVVEVWTVYFISAGGVQESTAAWATMRTELELVGSEWRVVGASLTEGPMPGLSSKNVPIPDSEVMAEELKGFDPVVLP